MFLWGILHLTSCTPGAAAFWGGFAQGFAGANGQTSSTVLVQSTVISAFSGLAYGNRYALANGQIWEQTEFYTWYHYAFRPNATVFVELGVTKIVVAGISRPVAVRRVY